MPLSRKGHFQTQKVDVRQIKLFSLNVKTLHNTGVIFKNYVIKR